MAVHSYQTGFSKWRLAALGAYVLLALLVAWIVFTLPLFYVVSAFSVLFLYLGCFFLLAYTETERKKIPTLEKWPSVSLVIPAWNRGESLRTCLEHVQRLKYPHPLQVIVVNDASTDQTKDILADFKKSVKAIHLEHNGGKAHAINTGLKHAKGEIIVVMDGDSYPHEDSLTKLIPHFYAQPNVGAVTTIVRVRNRNGWLQKIQEVEYFLEFGLKNSVLNTLDSLYVTPGPLSAYKKEALDQTKGYDEHNITEDMEITFHLHKLGYSIILEPDAQVFTDVPDTITKLYRQRQRWSYGGWQTIYKYRKHLFSKEKFFFRVFFPLRVMLDTSAILFLMLALRMFSNYYTDLAATFSAYSNISFETFFIPPIYLNSNLLLYLLIVGITLLMAYFGTKAANASAKELSPVGVVLFLGVYWVFIIGIQVISLVKAIMGGIQKW